MGFFDNSSPSGIGYADVKNTQDFTTETLFEKLSAVKVSFGTPEMGDIKGEPAVLYRNVGESLDVFARVHKSKVIIGKIGSEGVSSASTALDAGLSMFLDHKSAEESKADRAVDELLEVIKKLEEGETVTESTTSAPANTATGEAIELFMKQKAISIKPKFDIFDQNQNVVYHVEGDITRHNFSIQREGSEVIKMKKKLISIMPEYALEQNGEKIGSLKKKFKLTQPEVNGMIKGQDLQIAGDLLGFDFDICLGGRTIGHVDTARTIWSDCYRIAIFDAHLKDIVIALAIICDNVSDQEND